MNRGFIISFCVLASAYISTSVFADEVKYYIVDNSKSEISDLPRRSYREDLFVSVDGTKYLITNEHLQIYYHKSIFAQEDLDGDGRDEVILEIHHGGNCCGSEYAIVSHKGDTYFSIIQHEVFDGAGFPSFELVDYKGEKLIQVVNRPDGAETTSQSIMISLLKYEYGQLTLLSQTENAALIPAIVEVNSFEFDEDNPVQIIKEFDADGDDISDKLICDYWPRWASTVCDVDSSVFGYQNLSTGCNRFGVLSSETNGMKDLVCNTFSKLTFNGTKYVIIDE
jgi:hypothetical protein